MTTNYRSALLLLVALSLTGCARFPELDKAITEEGKAAPEPVLVDNRPLISAAATGSVDTTTRSSLQSRAATLQARSTALAGPVIDPAELAEIEAAHGRLRAETGRVAPEPGTR
ncbi:hypothetical protein [Tropicimonas isoalkanivorans]|uniref:Beta-barrel assembly machine subunit BamF n=1 Tax=Tropicimonas isoalkanivorans TaxID=441112 RepID=A0A1I1K2C2_9RHOB|nr:hypothetical protein [Tropicimonas isoalkanivorans]SFC55079.1 hypothetical protein SAMN04488094_10633 [Tropicimonas isoalkanivorans]